MATYQEQSRLRNIRAGGSWNHLDHTFSRSDNASVRKTATRRLYDADSAAREKRLEANDRRPGESATSRDTRMAASRTKPSHFVPFSVREAGWRSEGYRGKDAKRMAQFQSSTAGQSLGMGGTMDNPGPFGSNTGHDTQTPKADPLVTPKVGGNESPDGGITRERGGMFSGLMDKVKGAISSRLPQPGSPQGNFLMRGQDATPEQITQAHEYAASIGTTFDPKTGYNRKPFMQSQSGASPDLPPPSTSGKTYTDAGNPASANLPSPSAQSNAALVGEADASKLPTPRRQKDKVQKRATDLPFKSPDLNF